VIVDTNGTPGATGMTGDAPYYKLEFRQFR
jgi:hypothetical protein